jgi:gliding motility-associated-like protein
MVDQGLNTRSNAYCYVVAVENYCGLISSLDASNPHCTVELQATPLVDAIGLSWNAYSGWPQVEGYQVYRVAGYAPGAGQLIASLPGSTTTFLDTAQFCYEEHSYRVLAIGRPGMYSYSDTVTAAPVHFRPSDSVQIIRATVENNSFINVEWELPQIERLQMISVERDAGSGFVPIHSQAPNGINDQKYQDMDAEVAMRPYAYRVFGIDSCGDYTPLGLTGKTVHLQVERRQGNVILNWTPYAGWRNGVATYAIERYDENTGMWMKIGEVSGATHRYTDPESDMGYPVNSYRIIAAENNGYRTNSFSNEEGVVLDPAFYTANAFTPNGDGVNDFFKIEGIYLDQVSFVLFNRWGQQVYQTSSLTDGWDGRMSNGQSAPEGAYVYLLKGVGYGGQQIHRSGTITLIR